MIYLGIYFDYLPQLQKSAFSVLDALVTDLKSISEKYNGKSSTKTQPLILSFKDIGIFDAFLAVEAIEQTRLCLEQYAKDLRGVNVGIHRCDEIEEALVFINKQRMSNYEEEFSASSPALQYIGSFYKSVPLDGGWLLPGYRTILGSADISPLARLPGIGKGIAETIKKDKSRLIMIQLGGQSRSFSELVNELSQTVGDKAVLRLSASGNRPGPFFPFRPASFAELDKSIGTPSMEGAWMDTEPAFLLASASIASSNLSSFVQKGSSSYIESILDNLGDAIIVCEYPDFFSTEAGQLISSRLETGRGKERYLVVSDSTPPESWCCTKAIRISMPENRKVELERRIGLHTELAPPEIRQLLEKRAKALFSEDDNDSSILSSLPAELAIYLHALCQTEGFLEDSEHTDFFSRLGLPASGADILESLLVRCAFLDPATAHKPLHPIDRIKVKAITGRRVQDIIQEELNNYLVDKYKRGLVRPSLGFLKLIGERDGEDALILDCLFEEALNGNDAARGEKSWLSHSSHLILQFWRALFAADAHSTETALNRVLERLSCQFAATFKALAKTEFAYALGDRQQASISAREALLSIGKGTVPMMEARAHRLMGLVLLASDRHMEALDYLVNAQELSESASSKHERMMAAYSRAITEFLGGSIGKVIKTAETVIEVARELFNIEAMAAIEFILGRVEMELGEYDSAGRRFQAIASFCKNYDLDEAADRAMVWKGRSLAYAGSWDDAAAILERMADDPEARIFRGEMAILQGRIREASPWLEDMAVPAPRGFRPPDKFDWNSSFTEIEGRSHGFAGSEAVLSDYRMALVCLARGIGRGDEEAVQELFDLERSQKMNRANPLAGKFSLFCYLMEEDMENPPIDRQTLLSRAFKALQERAGRIEDRTQRAMYMEKNWWNRKLVEAARLNKLL